MAKGVGGDPTTFGRFLVARGQLDVRFMTCAELAALAETVPIGFLKMRGVDHVDSYDSISQIPGMVLFRPLTNSKALGARIVGGHPSDRNTIVGCLDRAIAASGRVDKWEVHQTALRSNLGGQLDLLSVSAETA